MSYEVVITREDGNWLADVPSVPGAHTWARSLAALIDEVRDVIILMDDLDEHASVETILRINVDDDLIQDAAQLRAERERLAAAEQSIQCRTAEILAPLADAGFSVRDTAALIGVSPGRVSQLAKARA